MKKIIIIVVGLLIGLSIGCIVGYDTYSKEKQTADILNTVTNSSSNVDDRTKAEVSNSAKSMESKSKIELIKGIAGGGVCGLFISGLLAAASSKKEKLKG